MNRDQDPISDPITTIAVIAIVLSGAALAYWPAALFWVLGLCVIAAAGWLAYDWWRSR